MTPSPDISFEHFDPQYELDNRDNDGKPIRVRKKPGRKPNPPSPAQRKAQNRAAQRAFRQRKRNEMKQAETAVKQSLYIRDQALGETQRLKTELEETRYENNYLKGSLLILHLTCIANRVDVPNLWDTGTDSDPMGLSKTAGLPQTMDIFLDKHRNIINLLQDNESLSPTELSPSSPVCGSLSPSSFGFSPPPSIVNIHEYKNCPLLSSSPGSSYSGSNDSEFAQDIPTTITNPSQCLSLGSSLPFSPTSSNTYPDSGLAVTLSAIDSNSDTPVDLEHVTGSLENVLLSNETMLNFEKWMDSQNSPQPSTTVLDPKTGLERRRTTIQDEEDKQFSRSPLSLSYSQLKSAPPMNTMEVLQYIRTVKNLSNDVKTLFKPTEMQRMVPHDARIDQVPCPMMRNQMILYQDFYNANELFDLLMESAMFSGGDVENVDDWTMAPAFLYKFWFLCPTQHSQRMDYLVDTAGKVGQKMIKRMLQRKAMYFENRCVKDDLHFTDSIQQNQRHQLQQQSQLYNQEHSPCRNPTNEMDIMTFDVYSKDDYSLDSLMTFVDDGDLLASV